MQHSTHHHREDYDHYRRKFRVNSLTFTTFALQASPNPNPTQPELLSVSPKNGAVWENQLIFKSN